jgi:hypothetical protein
MLRVYTWRYGEHNKFHNTEDVNIDIEETEPKTFGWSTVRSSHIPPPVDPKSIHFKQFILVPRNYVLR